MFDPSPKNMEKTTIFGKILIFSGTILKADRKQFWQTLRTYFAKGPKLTKYFIERPDENQKKMLCSCNLQFIERSQKILPISVRFWLNVWKRRMFFFVKHCFPQNVPVGSSIGDSATLPKFSFQKSRKLLIQVRKTWKKLQFLKKFLFFPERSSRLIESNFGQHSELILLKVWKWQNKSPNVRNKLQKKCWSHVTCSLQNAVEKIAVFRTFLAEKFLCETMFPSECSCFLLKNVPLDSQYAVKRAESAVNSFCHCPNVFRSKSEKQKRLFVKTLFSSKCSSGHTERKFGHSANFLA